MRSQGTLLSVQIWSCGGNAAGSSKLATVMSIQSGSAISRKMSGVPQRLQKPRLAPGLDANSAMSPALTVKPAAANVAQGTTGAPAARWHMRQWQ